MKKICYSIISACLIILVSCKETLPIKNFDKPILDSSFMSSSIASPQLKNVLIEEYTGVRCQNCPDGHVKLDSIIAKYGDKIVAVGIHNNSLAEPYGNEQDFRLPVDDELASQFGIGPKPAAVIDRTKDVNGAFSYNRLQWMSIVDQEITKSTKINITPTVAFDNTRSQYILNASLQFTSSYSSATSISVGLFENNILATQKDGSIDVPNYVHKHVLRAMLTNSAGNTLAMPTGGYEKGRSFIKQYAITTNPIWNLDNCFLVVFVTDNSTNEVLQASQMKLR